MRSKKAEWDDFRDWLETLNGSVLISTCSANNKSELNSIKNIAPEAGIAIEGVEEHEEGFTVHLAEKRHVPGE